MIGPVVSRKCQDPTFSLLLFHIFCPSYSPYQAMFLLPNPWLWLTFFLETLMYKQATSSPISLQCHLGPNLSTHLSKPLISHLENFLVKKSKSSCCNITKGHNTPRHLTKGVHSISFQDLLIVSIQFLISWVVTACSLVGE